MASLEKNLACVLKQLGRDVPNASVISRIAQVKARFKDVLEDIYKDTAPLLLSHVNSVYIVKRERGHILIVYVDESIFAAELNAQRELIRLRFREQFQEKLDSFEIHISRGDYKKRHPYNEVIPQKPSKSLPLSTKEIQKVRDVSDCVENPRVRQALKAAMTANLQWKE